jgi:hypothetical protein
LDGPRWVCPPSQITQILPVFGEFNRDLMPHRQPAPTGIGGLHGMLGSTACDAYAENAALPGSRAGCARLDSSSLLTSTFPPRLKPATALFVGGISPSSRGNRLEQGQTLISICTPRDHFSSNPLWGLVLVCNGRTIVIRQAAHIDLVVVSDLFSCPAQVN